MRTGRPIITLMQFAPAAGEWPLGAAAAGPLEHPAQSRPLRQQRAARPAGPFSQNLRAYWPEQQILDGTWAPPYVTRFR
jgi:hypothetical protein